MIDLVDFLIAAGVEFDVSETKIYQARRGATTALEMYF